MDNEYTLQRVRIKTQETLKQIAKVKSPQTSVPNLIDYLAVEELKKHPELTKAKRDHQDR